MPELDAAMRDYIAANAALGPILTEANGYYERADYKVDRMAEGKALHAKIVAAAGPFLAARAKVDALIRDAKDKVDLERLASIEKEEGRSPRWHVANVMLRAQRVMDLMPSWTKKRLVDQPRCFPRRNDRLRRGGQRHGRLRRQPSQRLLRFRFRAALPAGVSCATSRRRSTASKATRAAPAATRSPGSSTTTI